MFTFQMLSIFSFISIKYITFSFIFNCRLNQINFSLKNYGDSSFYGIISLVANQPRRSHANTTHRLSHSLGPGMV